MSKKLLPLLLAGSLILGQDRQNISRGATMINGKEITDPYAEDIFKKRQDKKKLARKNRRMRRK
ncbi:MAG: hypothetical protein PHX21_13110 [bacterium]|nr:hypothetical protein [bacterium]